ncbi:MAG: chaperone NapD [Comamonadaceae bacterium]|nr:chaperone NapD [Comamonadaceae bacterium]RRD58919.1 hypothetical protein EII20_00175 [Comamonadaceae bacterium OH2545_COT-014]
MSVLGIVVRTHPDQQAMLAERLAALPGCELGPSPGDGRLVIVLESTPGQPAAAVMGDVARWPEVLSISLVYEHSDPAEDEGAPMALDYRSWRQNIGAFARQQEAADRTAPLSHPSEPMSATSGAGELR